MERARPATAADLSHVVELARSLRGELRPMRGGELWYQRESRPEPLDTAYGALLDQPDTLLAVGCLDDVVLGFGVVTVETLRSGDRLGVVTDLFVEPDARSVGIGELIVERLIEFCAARGCVGVDAVALPGNRAAKNFFETNGFTARALVMHRTLHAPPAPTEAEPTEAEPTEAEPSVAEP